MTEVEALQKTGVGLLHLWVATRKSVCSDGADTVTIWADSKEELGYMAQEVGMPFDAFDWEVTHQIVGRSLVLAVAVVAAHTAGPR